jgi:hypothetical protein
MDPIECRKRAQVCREHAARSWGELRANFVEAAVMWDNLANQLQRRAGGTVFIPVMVKPHPGADKE